MPLITTCIGAYPKPAYVPTPDWFRTLSTEGNATRAFQQYLKTAPSDIVAIHDRATRDVVQAQVALGIAIPTDGEIRRENYIYYQCRNFTGFDFDHLTTRHLRNGAWVADVPTIVGSIAARTPILPRDYQVAQAATDKPVKITLPGPMTIAGSTADTYYHDEAKLGAALAQALNTEVLALAQAGCSWIQIDEPVFARTPDKAQAFGFDNLERCFQGLPDTVTRAVHICCGYPEYLDQEEYLKADQQVYFQLAAAIEASTIQAVSLEDAHRPNDLQLLEQFRKTKVILGSIAIARSRVESVEEIAARLEAALRHIDPEQLLVAPDCGLGYLPETLVHAKLSNMVTAAQLVG
jgi:5-methyltetrahydropteroyltriglutamate--homocysteine methyltransferase